MCLSGEIILYIKLTFLNATDSKEKKVKYKHSNKVGEYKCYMLVHKILAIRKGQV